MGAQWMYPFIRRLQRDVNERGRTVDNVIRQYLTTVRPGQIQFVENSKQFADLIILESGLTEVAIDIVVARIEKWMSNG